MTETKRKKRKSIFRALLIILLMSSVLVAVFLFATLFLRTETFYQYYLGKELELSAKRAADNVASFLRQGQESIERLAKDPVLLSELEKQENASKPKIFQIVNRVVAEESINPIIHIVTTDRQSIISTDYSIERYNPNHYAGLSHIFYDTDQTITLANSFVSGNGESVVLTIARQMFKGGNHLGYIYFDITEKEIENVIKAKEKIELTNYVPYVNYIVFTWYKYQLFNNSMIQPIHTQADSNYLRSSFTELFSQESARILTFDSEDGSDFLIASEKSADGELIVLSTVALNLLQKNINNLTLSVTTI
ncbi:MAG: hypothetical protein GX602_01335, partial [Dehalococcoidales bacterium]|nr:hypothetical protein [Dehalococcoidales bacterium]